MFKPSTWVALFGIAASVIALGFTNSVADSSSQAQPEKDAMSKRLEKLEAGWKDLATKNAMLADDLKAAQLELKTLAQTHSDFKAASEKAIQAANDKSLELHNSLQGWVHFQAYNVQWKIVEYDRNVGKFKVEFGKNIQITHAAAALMSFSYSFDAKGPPAGVWDLLGTVSQPEISQGGKEGESYVTFFVDAGIRGHAVREVQSNARIKVLVLVRTREILPPPKD